MTSFLLWLWNSSTFLALASLAVFFGYVPINRTLKRGRQFKHWLDDKVPFVPWFIFPYIFLYFPWLAVFYLSLVFTPVTEARSVFVATLVAMAWGYLTFLTFPTYVPNLTLAKHDIAHRLLQKMYELDKEFNAFPSMHVTTTMLLWLFSSQFWPQLTPLFTLAAVLISASTVLIKRHYLYDLGGGVLVGLLSYALARSLT